MISFNLEDFDGLASIADNDEISATCSTTCNWRTCKTRHNRLTSERLKVETVSRTRRWTTYAWTTAVKGGLPLLFDLSVATNRCSRFFYQ